MYTISASVSAHLKFLIFLPGLGVGAGVDGGGGGGWPTLGLPPEPVGVTNYYLKLYSSSDFVLELLMSLRFTLCHPLHVFPALDNSRSLQTH